jgi:hypothetical protein
MQKKGQNMELKAIKAELEAPKTSDAIKDAGRVRYGSGAIQFSDPAPARDAIKDAGRVRYGSGAINF